MQADSASSFPASATPRVGAVITNALLTRPRRQHDPHQEMHALQDLARQMLEQPDLFLPYLVQQAMQVSNACSAGISLHEPDALEGDVFRWHYLTGACSRFIGRTTPRHSSPCGLSLDEGGPVLIAYPEQFCSSFVIPGIISHEALIVPIYMANKKPLGALWVIAHDENRRFDSGDAQVLTELASFAGIALAMIQDARELKQELAMQETLTREMRHRISNILTVAGGLVTASARTASTPQELAVSVRGRLEALGNAQAILNYAHGDAPSDDACQIAVFADRLRELINIIAAPYGSDKGRITLVQPSEMANDIISVGQGALTSLGLILHELATNAVKYGALSTEEGRVNIIWHLEGEMCVLTWTEYNGPTIKEAPKALGFGSKLIRRTIAGQLGGNVSFEWLPQGLHTIIRMSLNALAK